METNLKIHLAPFPVPTSVRFSTVEKNLFPTTDNWLQTAPTAIPTHPPLPNEVRGDLQLSTLTADQAFEMCQRFTADVFQKVDPGAIVPQLVWTVGEPTHIESNPNRYNGEAVEVIKQLLDLMLTSAPSPLNKAVVIITSRYLSEIGLHVPPLPRVWDRTWETINPRQPGEKDEAHLLDQLVQGVESAIDNLEFPVNDGEVAGVRSCLTELLKYLGFRT